MYRKMLKGSKRSLDRLRNSLALSYGELLGDIYHADEENL